MAFVTIGRNLPIGLALLILCACSQKSDKIKGYDELIANVAKGPVGHDSDYWIEYQNMTGRWEKTGLIFGYVDDFGECQKAIAGLKSANPNADYRCAPANTKQP